MARWDPFLILCLDHDPGRGWWQVWRAYRIRLLQTRLILGEHERAVQAQRVRTAYQALRARAQRRQILADLVVQPGWLWRPVAHPDVAALAEAALPPLDPSGEGGLVGACDRRALAREAAALRLERTVAAIERGPRAWQAGCGGERGTGGSSVSDERQVAGEIGSVRSAIGDRCDPERQRCSGRTERCAPPSQQTIAGGRHEGSPRPDQDAERERCRRHLKTDPVSEREN